MDDRGCCAFGSSGLSGGFGVGEKRLDPDGELVGALDLRHVTDSCEQVGQRMRKDPAGGVEMVGGQDAIAIAPDDQGRAQMLCGRGGQFRAPTGLDSAEGGERTSGLEKDRARVGLAGDGQGVLDPRCGRQRRVGDR